MNNSPATGILIAASPGIFRDGLRKLLEAQPDFRVIGETGEGTKAIKLARKRKPNILLLDTGVAGNPGLQAFRELDLLSMPVRTLLLTARLEKDLLIKALQVGVRGIVLKDSTTQLLIKGIRSVMAGQYWLGHEGVSQLVGVIRKSRRLRSRNISANKFGLTRRELEIIGTVVAGYVNKDIAAKFSLSEQTVKHHLTHIFSKAGVSNRLELALFAIQHHLGETTKNDRPTVQPISPTS